MIPEVVVAMLACARIGAAHNVVFGGFSLDSVNERMEVSEAKVLITVDGARRKGKTAPIKQPVDAVMGDVAHQTIFVVRTPAPTARCRTAATSGTTTLRRPPTPCARPSRCRRTPALHPLLAGSTAKPKGILHTTGGYLTGRMDAPPRLRPQAR